MATLITSIHSQKGWRRIFVIGLHTWGLMFAILWLCHNYFRFESSFWLFQWVQEFLMLERPAAGWFVLILILFCIFILWFCGIRLVTRPTDQTTISHRFDIGLGFLLLFLLLLLVIKLVIATDKSGGELEILHYLFIGITIVILLTVAGFILYRLIKWLLSKIRWLLSETVEERDKRGIWELLLSCIIAATRILSTLRSGIGDITSFRIGKKLEYI